MLNWYLRYEPIIQILNAANATSAIDVGSGWSGLSWYWPHPVVQTDFEFSLDKPAEADRAGVATFVRSSADRLPFADDAFDFAVSSDMLEHLPTEIRVRSIEELMRVARRGVVIGFPATSAAHSLDRALARMIALARRARPAWLDEHLSQDGYPDRAVIDAALRPDWRVAAGFGNGGAAVQFLVVAAELTPGLRAVTGLLERNFVRRRRVVTAPRRRPVREIYHLEHVGPASVSHESG